MTKSTDNSQFTIATHGTIDDTYGVMWYEPDDTNHKNYSETDFVFRNVLVRTTVYIGEDFPEYREYADHMYQRYTPVLQGPCPPLKYLPYPYDSIWKTLPYSMYPVVSNDYREF
jgi:hypothetical protein